MRDRKMFRFLEASSRERVEKKSYRVMRGRKRKIQLEGYGKKIFFCNRGR